LEPYLADPAALLRRWALNRANSWYGQRQVIVGHLAPGWQPWHLRIDHTWEMRQRDGFAPYPSAIVTDEYRARKRAEVRAGFEIVARHRRVQPVAGRQPPQALAGARPITGRTRVPYAGAVHDHPTVSPPGGAPARRPPAPPGAGGGAPAAGAGGGRPGRGGVRAAHA